MATVGFVGTGTIASAMVRALAGRGQRILVSERGTAASQALADAFEEVVRLPAAEVVAEADTVFLCLRAAAAEAALRDLPFQNGQTVISVMAGVPMAALRAFCAPVTDIAMTIPMPFIAAGGCPLPVFPECPPLARLFGPETPVIAVSGEDALGQHFAAATMIPAAMLFFGVASSWLGERTGDPRGAEAYVAALLPGYLAEMSKDGEASFNAALAEMATPGGISAMMADRLTEGGVPEALTGGLDRIGERLRGR